MKGRADSPEKKRAVIERLYAAWMASPSQRLGQLIENSCPAHAPGPSLFFVEDEELVDEVEKLAYKK